MSKKIHAVSTATPTPSPQGAAISNLLNRANELVQQAKAKADAQAVSLVEEARQDHLAAVTAAQQAAENTVNNTLFDALYVIACGRLQKLNPSGELMALQSNAVPDFALPEKVLTFKGNGSLKWKPPMILGNFTLEVWVAPDVIPNMPANADVFRGLLGGGRPGDASNRSACLYIHNNYGIHTGFGTGSQWCSFRKDGVLPPGQWNHVAVTFDSTLLQLYVNGEVVFSTDQFKGQHPKESADCGVDVLGVLDNWYSGQVFDVRVWHLARTQWQIKEAMYQVLDPSTEEGLWVYFPLRSETDKPYVNLYKPNDPPATPSELTWEAPQVSQFFKPDALPYVADLVLDLQLSGGPDTRIVYASLAAPFCVMTCDLEGGDVSTLYAGSEPISSVAVDKQTRQIFWIEGTGVIKQCAADGRGVTQVRDISTSGKKLFWQLDVDSKNKQVYWTNDSAIWRVNYDGSAAEIFVSCCVAPYPVDIVVDEDHGFLYWVDQESKSVGQVSLSEGMSSAKHLFDIDCPNRGLAVDPSKQQLYWSELDADKKHWLMRGSVADGASPGQAQQVFEIPCEGGLAIFSQSDALYEQRLQKIQERAANQKQADGEIAQANLTQQMKVDEAKGNLAKTRATAQAQVAKAKQDNKQGRQQAQTNADLARQASSRRVALAKSARDEKMREAQGTAGGIKAKAQVQADDMRSRARRNLDAANREKAKY